MSNELPPRCAHRYELVQLLSAGAFGSVARAVHRELGRPVALKLLHGARLKDPDIVKRFLAEARVTASLSHPNIVRVHDHDIEDGIPWIAYELVEGGTLADLARDGALRWADACRIGAQLASALDAAHSAGVLHRDLKPANVLHTGDGVFKVTDFGLAKYTHDGTVLTKEGALLGTPAYMAPEFMRGVEASPASDIYALGVMLYELLTGERPFSASTPAAMLAGHAMKVAPRVRDLRPEVPETLDELVAAMLEKLPERRPPSASAVAAALRALTPASTQTVDLHKQIDFEEARDAAKRAREHKARRTITSVAVTPAPARFARPAAAAAVIVVAVLIAALARPPGVPPSPPPPRPGPSQSPTSFTTRPPLSEEARRNVLDALRRWSSLRSGKNNLAAYVSKDAGPDSVLGLDAPGDGKARERARELAGVHREIARETAAVLARLREAQGGPDGAPLADQLLWCEVLADRAVSHFQSARADALVARLQEGLSVTAALVDSRTCYPPESLTLQYDFWRAVTSALENAGQDPRAIDAAFANLYRQLHWVAGYFVFFSVCGTPGSTIRASLRERSASWLRGQAPAGTFTATLRQLAVDVVAAALLGASPEARARLARIETAMDTVTSRHAACGPVFKDILERITTAAGR